MLKSWFNFKGCHNWEHTIDEPPCKGYEICKLVKGMQIIKYLQSQYTYFLSNLVQQIIISLHSTPTHV